ncbi:hypothetical protein BDV98DRAFT_597523 [Pterulicium gracile]|uniref:Uncharacterized protein n=1 Tax=Pterulicium gracile TaxID=1884261 RepID=A0A5C3Q3V6_9AGAR|nr:hypothetical protein BDV98DRAFT_597523 [Pterula gracilis]
MAILLSAPRKLIDSQTNAAKALEGEVDSDDEIDPETVDVKMADHKWFIKQLQDRLDKKENWNIDVELHEGRDTEDSCDCWTNQPVVGDSERLCDSSSNRLLGCAQFYLRSLNLRSGEEWVKMRAAKRRRDNNDGHSETVVNEEKEEEEGRIARRKA